MAEKPTDSGSNRAVRGELVNEIFRAQPGRIDIEGNEALSEDRYPICDAADIGDILRDENDSKALRSQLTESVGYSLSARI